MKLLCIAFLFLGTAVHAGDNPTPDGKLDMTGIRNTFQDGDLDSVRVMLESFQKQHGSTATRDEKAFTYKYLGVIYAAKTSTRAKAESYFNLLLPLSPNIELTDMYVPKGIESIFENVKNEYLHSQEYNSKFDALGNPKNPVNNTPVANPTPQASKPPIAAEPPKKKDWIWWTVGGAATVAVGTGVVLMMSQGTSSSSPHFDGSFKK